MTRMMGLRFDTLAKDDVDYLVFYDLDLQNITQEQTTQVDTIMRLHNISYILYSTKNGYHIIGLTPLNNIQWASAFSSLKKVFNQYYGGVVIRLSRKRDETQTLIHLETNYGEVIPNLFNLYAGRFNLQKKPWNRETTKHVLVFEKYRTPKT